jgi:hypothetical protein
MADPALRAQALAALAAELDADLGSGLDEYDPDASDRARFEPDDEEIQA